MVKGKKGSIQDLIVIATVVLVFAVGTLIAFKISDDINTKFQASDDINSNGKEAFGKINSMYPGVVDSSFLLLTLGLCVVALILAMLVRFHPVFFVFFLLFLVIIIFVSGIFSNIYLEMANQAELTSVASQLTFITHIMGFLPFIIGIFGFILSFVMYKLWSAEQ